ncbi:MAG: FHA domain-containing protein, partial [Vicinamibacteria bacterium]
GTPRLRETSAPAWAARKIDLIKPVTTIGRSIDSDVVLVEDAVSSEHCRVERDRSEFRIVDLGSKNKTWVNGAKVKTSPLNHGDQIRVGTTTFVFELPDDSA